MSRKYPVSCCPLRNTFFTSARTFVSFAKIFQKSIWQSSILDSFQIQRLNIVGTMYFIKSKFREILGIVIDIQL